MKKLLLLAALAAFMTGPALAQLGDQFSATSPSGHTLYYRVIDVDNHYVAATCPNDNLLTDGFEFWNEPCSTLWGTGYPTGSVTLPETVSYGGVDYTVRAIGAYAFFKCPIMSITMPNTIDSIGDLAFYYCSNLFGVTFSNSLRTIGGSAFLGCMLGNVVLPSSVRILKQDCFAGARITDIALNDGLEVMEFECIGGNLFDSLYIPASVCNMNDPIFYSGNVTRLVVDPANPCYDSRNDCNCIINSETGDLVKAFPTSVIPEGVTTIGDCMRGNNIKTLVLPSTVHSLNFHECHIGKLVINSSFLILDYGLTFVDSVQVLAETPPLLSLNLDVNSSVELSKPVIVRCDAIADYQAANGWKKFTNYVGVYPYRVTAQGDGHGIVQVVQPTCAAPTATLTAMPDGGYHFVQWSDGVYDNPRTLSLVGDSVLTATFAPTDTVHVTIAEGESYLGHTTAGIYLDTIAGYVPDSIICSLVSLVVNRPLDNCEVQVVSEVPGLLTPSGLANGPATASYEVMPGSQLSVPVFLNVSLDPAADTYDSQNLVANGDFEQGDGVGFSTDYYDCECMGFVNTGSYDVYPGGGVDGSYGMAVDGHTLADKAFWEMTVECEPGAYYQFSYMARMGNSPSPRIQLSANGVQAGGEDVIPGEDYGQWYTYSHYFQATSSQVTLRLVDLNLEGGGNDFYLDNISLIQTTTNHSDTITITNTHGLVYDTVDVAIAEGDTLLGHTLAGIYQDTIIGAETDSIVHSRVSMTVDRPLDNCTLPIYASQASMWKDLATGEMIKEAEPAVTIPPAESHVLVNYTSGFNLLENGDFELGNVGFTSDYPYWEGCNHCDPFHYDVREGYGVDGSQGISVDGAYDHDMSFYRATVPTVPGREYMLSYMAKNSDNVNIPYFAIKINGSALQAVDTLSSDLDIWVTYSHQIEATEYATTIEIINEQTEGGNDFYFDNVSLICITETLPDTITLTNSHGLVYDTVDVTIAEGNAYHSRTLPGVYLDTVIGSATDSIVYARVSMNINHTFGAGIATVGTNQEGRLWMGLDGNSISTQQEMTVQVPPTTEQRYVLTSLADGSNLQPNGDLEQGQYVNWSTDYAWGDTPFQGSHYFTVCDTCGRTGKGIAAKGSGLENRYVYTSEWVNLVEGHRYSFSYWAKSHSGNPALLAVDLHDQQNTYRIADTADLGEAMDGWKRFEHVFTPNRTYASLLRITDLNTSENGNEFFLDDISLVDLTTAADAQRDTVVVRNIHQLHYATVDVTLNEGQSHNGYTTVGVYSDTTAYANYDSIVRTRVSYVLNTTGAGFATLSSNVEGTWIDLDNNSIHAGDSISVWPTEMRTFGLLTPAQDTNLIVNGDFEQGNTGFTSHYLYRPEPYDIGDGTYYIGGYRINTWMGNHYLYGLNYYEPREGSYYSFTAQVEPDTWYRFSYRGATTSDNWGYNDNAPNNRNDILIDSVRVSGDTLVFNSSIETSIEIANTYSAFFYSGNRTSVNIQMTQPDANIHSFVIDDVTLTPLAVSDTVTITNRHQVVYATVDTTINEGESYKDYTLAGVYADTLFFTDYDSIVTSRVSMVINRRSDTVQLGTNRIGMWSEGPTVVVPPMQTRQFTYMPYPADHNLLPNSDFEQGNTGFGSEYPYVDCHCFDYGHYSVVGGEGVDGSYCLLVDGGEYSDSAFYYQTVAVTTGVQYRFSYKAKARCGFYGSLGRVALLVDGVQLDGEDIISGDQNDCNAWNTFERTFTATSDTVLIKMVDLNTEVGDNDFYVDDIRLQYDVALPTDTHTISVTNRHLMVVQEVDTTIAEGESYRGYTQPGYYYEEILEEDVDSLITTRLSMVINHTVGEGWVTLNSNVSDAAWIGLDTVLTSASPSITTLVEPMQQQRFLVTRAVYSDNLVANGDFEDEYWYTFTSYNSDGSSNSIQSEYGNNGTKGLVVSDTASGDALPYGYGVSTIPGHLYTFSYSYKSNCITCGLPSLSFYVDGEERSSGDKAVTWESFSHSFVALNYYTELQLRWDTSSSGMPMEIVLDDISLVDHISGQPALDTITVTNRHQLVWDTLSVDVCQGSTYEADGIQYGENGIYTLNTRLLEDSTVYPSLIVTMRDNYYPQLDESICQGDSYAFGGMALGETGTYYDTLYSIYGCDSTVTLNLTVYDHSAAEFNEVACDNYQWLGETLTASVLRTDTIVNVHGCDSVVTLNLTVNYSTTGDTVASECDQYQWYDQFLGESGSYQHTLTNAVGCDSVLTLSLEVRRSTTGSEQMAVCDSVTWHGQWLDASGSYQDVMTNAVDCDSVITLDLTVNPTYQHTDAVFACDNHLPYVYHGSELAEAGDHTVVLQSAEGCDSTLTVTLTVGATYRHADAVAVCQSGMPYTYGSVTFQADQPSGTYDIPFESIEGCDSTIALDLTVHESENTEIYVVTVSGTHNVVVWDRKAVVEHYNIYRESSTAGTYSLMAEVPYDNLNLWIDSSSDSRARSYRYRISSTDSCGVESEQSELHRTMHLTISQGINGSWNLVWTEYEGTSYTTYRIYRGSSYNSLEMIDEIPSANTTYTDYNAPAGDVYYQIVILMGPLNAKDEHPNAITSNIATNAEVGIGTVSEESVRVYVHEGQVVAEAPRGVKLRLFDAAGRELATCVSTGRDTFEVPASGSYLLQAAGHSARRVVVVK